MSWYHSIPPRRINDPRVRGCSSMARVVWAVLMAGELATKVPGLAQGGRLSVAEVLEVEPQEAGEALAELEACGVLELDSQTRLIRLLGVAEDYRRLGRSVCTATHWIRRCRDLPPCPLLARHAAELRGVSDERLASAWDELIAACGERRLALPPAAAPAKETAPPASLPPAPAKKPKPKRKTRQDSPALAGLRLKLEAAQAILVKGRVSLGFDDAPEPVTASVLKLAATQPPEVIAKLEVMVRRAIERRRREYERGEDYRRYLTLSAILRMSEQFFNAKDLDGPPQGARGPPAAGFIEGPTSF